MSGYWRRRMRGSRRQGRLDEVLQLGLVGNEDCGGLWVVVNGMLAEVWPIVRTEEEGLVLL